MATLSYLWKNRSKHQFLSINYFKSWAKRVYTFKDLMRRNMRRISLVKRGALIHETSQLGEVIVEGPANLLKIGASSVIGKAFLRPVGELNIGNFVVINDGVKVYSGSHDVSDPKWNLISRDVVIEDYVWIGTNAIILSGVHIGKGAVVGAGAVVSKDVPEYAIVVGNPAVILDKKRNKKYNKNYSI